MRSAAKAERREQASSRPAHRRPKLFTRSSVRPARPPTLDLLSAWPAPTWPWERRAPESSSGRAAFAPQPPRAARPAKRCELTGCAPDLTALRLKLKAGAQQRGGGLWEPAASAGKSRGFSVPGRGMGGAPHPPQCLLRSAACADGTRGPHRGARGARAPSVDVRPRRRDEGGRTRGAPVDPGLSPALPASRD